MTQTKLSENKRKELDAIFQLSMESKTVHQATERVSCILDASCENATQVKEVTKHCCHSFKDRCEEIFKILLQKLVSSLV